MKRLRELKDKYPVRIVNFFLHPDGFRILLEASHPGQVSDAMRFFKTVTAQDWQRRKKGWRPSGSPVII